ncbi:hypothetical protein C8Q74DRAFT_927808 [Fomes fomentarius]|nr:hypothetical protein C8Q74DRAFT_927808 [Fomes fomentarius]
MVNALTRNTGLTLGPIILETLVKHYFERLSKESDSEESTKLRKEELLYDEAFNIIKSRERMLLPLFASDADNASCMARALSNHLRHRRKEFRCARHGAAAWPETRPLPSDNLRCPRSIHHVIPS